MNAEKCLHSSFYCKYFTYDIRFILESAKPIIDDPRVYEELYKIVAQPEVFRQDCMLSSEYIFRFLEKLSMNFYEYLCIYENISRENHGYSLNDLAVFIRYSGIFILKI